MTLPKVAKHETKKISIKRAPATAQPHSAHHQSFEDHLAVEEPLEIRIHDEPVSITDVPHSLMHLWADHFYQAFRLYLVPDDATDEGLVERLRAEVSGWDRG